MRPVQLGPLARLALAAAVLGALLPALPVQAGTAALSRIKHIVVLQQEGWSYDSLLSAFDARAGVKAPPPPAQSGPDGRPLGDVAPPREPYRERPDRRFPRTMPAVPFPAERYLFSDSRTIAPRQSFASERQAIDGGRMDGYAAAGGAGALPMAQFDGAQMPGLGLASRYTVADRYFHPAFGGTLLNHLWLVCGCTPTWPDAPEALRSGPDPVVSADGHVINDMFPSGGPHPDHSTTAPAFTEPTIADRLDAAGVSWAWYSGGWADAVAGTPDPSFQFAAQPLAYFANHALGTPGGDHLRDERDLFSAIATNRLPAVSFVQPLGINDEHPGYTDLITGQQHVLDILTALQRSDAWSSTVMLLVYSDNGGHWDHVPPPAGDAWGPGTRVPLLVVSPLARKAYVDHTTYDATSILRLISDRFGLRPVGSQERTAGDLRNSLDLYEGATPLYGTTAFGTVLATILLGVVAAGWWASRRPR